MKLLRILIWPFKAIYRALSWYFGLFRGRAWYTKMMLSVLTLVLSIVVFFIMVDINFLGLFGSSPGYWELRNPEKRVASEIYSADGKIIGKYYSENRQPVSFNSVTPVFWKALIDTEDERYFDHWGIDFSGVMAAFKDAVLRQKPRGASTIEQQLAKNLFSTRSRHNTGLLCSVPGLGMLINKTKEWIVAVKLETMYSKEDILIMYANTVEFGGNIFGIKTAAKTYFDKSPKELSVEECAVLVGMLKAITTYNPRINPDKSKERRNVVMRLMHQHGHLSKSELDELSEQPIKLSLNIEQKLAGEAPYFRDAVAKELEEWCESEGIDLYNDGLKIYTTIDTKMQKYAEAAVEKQMLQIQRNFNDHWSGEQPWRDDNGRVIPNFVEDKLKKLPVYEQLNARFDGNRDSINRYLNKKHTVKLFSYVAKNHVIEKEMSTRDSLEYMLKFMHCSFVAMEPQTGYVKAYVGDVNYNTWQYDKARAMRQPGSTFKLFVYTEAMNQGMSPCTRRKDEYFALQNWDPRQKKNVVWAPGNANGKFSGDSLTLKNAFARSVNSIAVRLGQELGVERIAETAHDMGIKGKLDATPALALGASDVMLYEMVNAYTTIANNGNHVEPVMVTKILDASGDVIYRSQPKIDKAIPAISAFYMQQLLKGGLREAGGTSVPMLDYISSFSDTDFGGKTGTTNNNSDGWYMCVTPNLVCGAWVGGEYRSIHFRTGALGAGGKTALPICGMFMRSVLSDKDFRNYHGYFRMPDDIDLDDYSLTCENRRAVAQQDTIDYYDVDTVDIDERVRNIDEDELINDDDLDRELENKYNRVDIDKL